MIGELLVLSGALLTLAAAVGMFRFDDVFTRMHALAKANTLAVVLIFVGAALEMSHPNDITSLLLAAALQVLTSPVASDMISFATYRTEEAAVAVTVLDDPGDPPPGSSVRRHL